MAAITVHVAVTGGQTAIAKQDCNLVQRLRVERPKIPLHISIPQVSLGMAFLGVNEVGELMRIADEEDGRVITH